jgi:hypothetical protein
MLNLTRILVEVMGQRGFVPGPLLSTNRSASHQRLVTGVTVGPNRLAYRIQNIRRQSLHSILSRRPLPITTGLLRETIMYLKHKVHLRLVNTIPAFITTLRKA